MRRRRPAQRNRDRRRSQRSPGGGGRGRHCELRAAAAATGVAYETARKLVASAMRKAGAARQTDLVRRILAAAAGDVRSPEGSTRLLADLFGLTLRQATLAQAIAHGATRDAAAAAVGASTEAAKAELKIVYQACGIASAVDLARIAGEVDALAGLATACSIEIAPRGEPTDPEPLRLVARRRAAGRIAVTDHGPARGSRRWPMAAAGCTSRMSIASSRRWRASATTRAASRPGAWGLL